jgi:hypothetical protein
VREGFVGGVYFDRLVTLVKARSVTMVVVSYRDSKTESLEKKTSATG